MGVGCRQCPPPISAERGGIEGGWKIVGVSEKSFFSLRGRGRGVSKKGGVDFFQRGI